MKYCRFLFENQTHYGAVEERNGELWIVDLAPAPEEDLAFRLEPRRSASPVFEPMPLSAARLLAPVTPSKIVCIGRNYREHVKELCQPSRCSFSRLLHRCSLPAASCSCREPRPAWTLKASWRWS
jgi:2-keto-4-pentenoate hydratase/2-oxohepta-3-ene-1,7-dioic acid hydratase in catechol pathway